VEVETLLIIFAFAIALSVVFQAFFFWRLADSTKLLMNRLDRVSTELESDAKEILDQLRSIVASVEHLKHVSEGFESRANELNVMFGERVRDIDQLVGTLLEVGSKQAEKVDAVITDTVEKFEETTAVIQQDIVKPVIEMSSLVKGLKTGLEYLFSKKQIRADNKYPEDQLFI
jgi:hypothetical protein